MFHGEAFLIDVQQSGPRGFDKFFSTNWWMPMAQRKFGNGTLTIRTMLSFEPATVSNRRYPGTFPTGRNRLRPPHRGRPAPTRFLHGTRRALRLQAGRSHAVVFLRRAHGRSCDGARRLSSPGLGIGRSHRAARTSPSGLHPHCGGRRYARNHASQFAAGGFRAFTDASPTNSAGTSTPEKSTPGPLASPSIQPRTGALSIRLRSCTAQSRLLPRKTSAG